jgi:hypothetical protein
MIVSYICYYPPGDAARSYTVRVTNSLKKSIDFDGIGYCQQTHEKSSLIPGIYR